VELKQYTVSLRTIKLKYYLILLYGNETFSKRLMSGVPLLGLI